MDKIEMALQMYCCAMDYEKAASRLSQFIDDSYLRSARLLHVLAIEVLLKCVHLIDRGEYIGSHDYTRIWAKITESTRVEILAEAATRAPGYCDMRKVETALVAWKKIFTKGRYDYELNAHRTSEEVERIGREWMDSGARPEDADLAYYRWERECIIYGIRKWVEPRIDFHYDAPL